MKPQNLKASNWGKEFQSFTTTPENAPPHVLSESILNQVEYDLKLSIGKMAAKLVGIHAVMSYLSLFICSQFGMSHVSSGGLMSLFMRMGPHFCMFMCGTIFISGSVIMASVILRREEFYWIRNHAMLTIGSMGLISIGAMTCLGAPIWALGTLIWLFGIFISGLFWIHAMWLIRQHAIQADRA